MRRFKAIAGIAIWLILIGSIGWSVSSLPIGEEGTVATQLVPEVVRYVGGRQKRVHFGRDEPLFMNIGQPVFIINHDGTSQQVGHIVRLDIAPEYRRGSTTNGMIVLYEDAPKLGLDANLIQYEVEHSIESVMATMLPEEKQLEIAIEIQSAFQDHSEEIIATLKPIMQESLQEAYAIVQDDLPPAIEARKEKFASLGRRYGQEIVREEIVPLVKEEIWPIVREESEPLVADIGKEIWSRASVWRFGWRYVYDRSLKPSQSLVRSEWNRFVKQEATPVLEAHTEEIIQLQKEILTDIAGNSRVRSSIHKNLTTVVKDPELRTVIWEIIQEVIIDNPKMREALDRRWNDPRARNALRLAANRLQPTVERIGQILFGDAREGLNPEFVQVLRNQVLYKDQRWLVLQPGASEEMLPHRASLPLSRGKSPQVNPFAQQVRGSL